jgi:transcriptional regulator with XRE-family HTH domain
MRQRLEGLKRRRLAAGIGLTEAGGWLGVTKQHFAKLEAGASPLDISRARIVAERLGCSIEALF